MADGSGGVAAAFGFRYQYLVTAEELLDLYEHAPAPGWRLGVDLQDQDSADILVFPRPAGPPSRAVQVKASMASATTKMDLPMAARCLDALDAEHPSATKLVLVTNRVLTGPAAEHSKRLRKQHGKRVIDARTEDVREIVVRLIARIARIRARGKGGMGQRLHHILLAQLLELIFVRGSQAASQSIDYSQVADILDESAAVLADAAGARSWGRVHGMPVGSYVPRPAIMDFLSEHLPEDRVWDGAPDVAVLSGLHGSGKSAAVASWTAARREQYAVSIWVDAGSRQRLLEQTPALLEWLGADGMSFDDPAQDFCDALSDLPVPWLLVLDGALDASEARAWIPASGYGHVIVTTNRRDWPIDTAPQLEVEGMADDDAIALIRHRLPAPQEADKTAMVAFAARLGRWPLAIDLACAWVRGLGGDHTQLPEFLARLDRLDLLTGGAQLGGYPKDVSAVINELWEGVSPPGRAVLGIVILSGGAHVPLMVIDRWAASLREAGVLEVDPRMALDELVDSALVTRRLRYDAGGFQGIDEAVYVHEGIQAMLSGSIGVDIPFVFLWLESFTLILSDLLDSARLAEAASLLPAAEGLLRSLLMAGVTDRDGEQPLRTVLLTATTLMHNLGALTTLTGALDTAWTWLRLAVDTRGKWAEPLATDGFAVLQIQTLAALVQVALRQSRRDEIGPIIKEALHYVEGRSVDGLESTGVQVVPALHALAHAAVYAAGDSTHLRERIEAALEGRSPGPSEESALQQEILHVNALHERVRAYAGSEQWSRAVSTVLIASNRAVDAGMLVQDAVSAVLDTALELMQSRLLRPHTAPADSWVEALDRLVEWGEANIDSFDEQQRLRFSILVPFASQDVQRLRAVLDQMGAAGTGSSQVKAWMEIGSMALETITAQKQFEGLVDRGLPESVQMIRTINGGGGIRWWPISANGESLLVFVTVGASMYAGVKTFDPVREYLVSAGFPRALSEDSRPHLAAGWSVTAEEGTLVLRGPQGEKLVDVHVDRNDPHLRKWWSAAEQAGAVRVVYRDAADLTPEELLATDLQALVEITGATPSGTWWSRFRSRWRRTPG